MSERTEAQEAFSHKPDRTFDVGQFNRMGMWFIRRTTVEIVALSPTEYGANEIRNAFITAEKTK